MWVYRVRGMVGVGLPREWVDVGLPCQRVGGCGFTESEDGLVGRLVWVYRVRVCGFVWGYRVRGWVGWCGFTESDGGWLGVDLPRYEGSCCPVTPEAVAYCHFALT